MINFTPGHSTPETLSMVVHSAVRLTTGSQSVPKRVLHSLRSCTSFFNFQHPLSLSSLKKSSSFLSFLPSLPVTSIRPSNFTSITYFRKQILRKI